MTTTEKDLAMVKALPGALFEDEPELLYQLAREVAPGRCIVEIGSFLGKSSACLALGSLRGNRGLVYCIDPHEAHMDENRAVYGPQDLAAWTQNVTRADVWEVVRPLAVRSTWCRAMPFPPIGLLFVDGAHNVKAVVEDFRTFEEKVWMASGKAVFHDSNMEEVATAIEILTVDTAWKIIDEVNLMTVIERRP